MSRKDAEALIQQVKDLANEHFLKWGGPLSALPLLPIEPKSRHSWPVIDGKKNGVLVRRVRMVVPAPGRNEKEISLVPLKHLVSDGCSLCGKPQVTQYKTLTKFSR